MRNAKRLGAAAVATSVSLLTTAGLAEAIKTDQQATGTEGAGGGTDVVRAAARDRGPSRLVVIRRRTPAGASSSGGTIYVQAPPTTTTAMAPAAPAPAPAAPTTRSS
jgi:hypothetical protein